MALLSTAGGPRFVPSVDRLSILINKLPPCWRDDHQSLEFGIHKLWDT